MIADGVYENCLAITFKLAEFELFGYEGGAFSGALTSGKSGWERYGLYYFQLSSDKRDKFVSEDACLQKASSNSLMRQTCRKIFMSFCRT